MDYNLSSKEFAEKYLNHRIELLRPADSPRHTTQCFGYIVGYTCGRLACESESLIISFEDPLDKTAEYPVLFMVSLVEGIDTGWRIPVKYIKLAKEVKPVVLYTNKCNKCKFSCRIVDRKIFCSNSKCKYNKLIRNKFNAGIPIDYYKLPHLDKHQYVICTTCKQRIARIVSTGVYNKRYCYCINGHGWEHTFSDGEKIIHLSRHYKWVTPKSDKIELSTFEVYFPDIRETL